MKSRRRGVFLIGVLFIIVLITMFVGASIDLAPWALRRADNQGDLSAAHRAARSGIEYALARLRANPAWRAETPAVINEPGLTIVEGQGNVIGLLNSGVGVSQFRLRFNYQDGPGGGDGMNDPGALAIEIPLVSINNVVSPTERAVPRADGPGFSVPATPTIHTTVPAHGVFLVCEGRTGNWLQTATAANPNPAPPAMAVVTTTRLETVYKVNNIGQAVTPSVASSADEFKAQLPLSGTDRRVELDSAETSETGRIRSRTTMDITNGDTQNLVAAAGQQGEYRHVGAFNGSPASNVMGSLDGADGLYQIDWPPTPASEPLRAGVYTVSDDGILRYYDGTLEEYKTRIAADVNDMGDPFTLPSTVTPNSSAGLFTLTITGNTEVVAGATTSDLVIIPKKGADPGEGAPGGGGVESWATRLSSNLAGHINYDGSKFEYFSTVGLLMNKVAEFRGHTSGSWTIAGPFMLENIDPNASNSVLNDPGGPPPVAYENFFRTNFVPNHLLPYINSVGTSHPAVAAALASLSIDPTGGGPIEEIPAVSGDTTTPQNILVRFAPESGSSAALTGPGAMTLGARLEGEGGSIRAEGNINLVGLGVDLAAASNPNEGVSLYSKGDVFISTYDKASNSYRDVGLKGVVYTWGNFIANLGADSLANGNNWGVFQLNGSLIAYGKDPSSSDPVTGGKIQLKVRRANLKFDSSYLLDVMGSLPPGIGYGRVWWLQQQ